MGSERPVMPRRNKKKIPKFGMNSGIRIDQRPFIPRDC